ncbi:MAG TPA: glycoside hydrolase family 3 N-terminal domain-containing protein [Gemmatimonadaceae bacterium]|nr:glycoside hydrolase family 3 N-terminal domain-containing protein [Gemmatimonadaceae bacterium]
MKILRLLLLVSFPALAAAQTTQPVLGSRAAPIITRDGLRFRDLNRNGKVDPYEDWRLSPDVRARDLIGRMTLEEKAGTMMHGTARSGGPAGSAGMGASYDTAANRILIDSAKVTSMITRLRGDATTLATQNNALQEIAERTRLGIPVTISTDPRNHFQDITGASVVTPVFSQWPETLGFAAIGDAALVRRFGDIARQEYRAAGIQMTLSPQADLATEPRWGRINGTFGEDADLTARMVRAYIEGFQHGAQGVDKSGVAAVVKHWVGYGAQRDGLDSHNYYGRYAVFGPSSAATNIAYQIRPFVAAFDANVAGVMPTYSILQGATWNGKPIEQVGAGFNRQLLTDILRKRYGYRGLVITDWAITNDCGPRCRQGAPAGERPSFADVGMPWGVEDIPMRDRFVKAVRAGVDQFGGTERTDLLVDAVHSGELTEARLDSSVARVLAQKFALGLFENPYVDPAAAARVLGNAEFRNAGLAAQRRALVLLENDAKILPLSRRARRVYVRGIDSAAIVSEGWTVVTDPAQADLAIIRISAPSQQLHPQFMMGQFFHEGSLAYSDSTPGFGEFMRVSAKVPTIAVVYLDRPAVLTPIKEHARALIGSFGVSDQALLDVLTGRARPEGKLPFDLPASMEEVDAQRPDLAHDIRNPLYRFGYGLRY